MRAHFLLNYGVTDVSSCVSHHSLAVNLVSIHRNMHPKLLLLRLLLPPLFLLQLFLNYHFKIYHKSLKNKTAVPVSAYVERRKIHIRNTVQY